MGVPNNVLRCTLAQYGQHDANLLPVLLFWSRTWLFEHVLHLVCVDRLKLVNRDQGAPLVALVDLLQVLVDLLLIHLFRGQFRSNFGPDHALLHEVRVEAWISQLRDDLDELRVVVLGDLRALEVLARRPEHRVESLMRAEVVVHAARSKLLCVLGPDDRVARLPAEHVGTCTALLIENLQSLIHRWRGE